MTTKRSKVVDQYIDIGYLLEYLQTGSSEEQALNNLGRSKKWYYDVKRRYPKLQEAIKQAEREGEEHIKAMAEFVETINSVEEVEAPEVEKEEIITDEMVDYINNKRDRKEPLVYCKPYDRLGNHETLTVSYSEYNWEDDYNYEEPRPNVFEQIILTSLVFIGMLDVIMILYILYMVATM